MKLFYKWILTAVISCCSCPLFAQPGLNVQNRINSKVQTRVQGKVVSNLAAKTAATISGKVTKKASSDAAKKASASSTQKINSEIKIAGKEKKSAPKNGKKD